MSTAQVSESNISSTESNLVGSKPVSKRRKATLLVTSLHLLCIAVFATFICWGAKGHVPLNGDDMRVLHRVMLKCTDLKYDYLAWTRSRMHTVALLYDEYKIAGDSMERANLIWLGIYVLSAFAGYGYLRKVFSPTVALLGALTYLSYSSKVEPLTWWSAGAYTLIWLAYFGMMSAFESKLQFKVKSILVSTVIFFSMYIYEVFTCIVPFLSLILLLRRKREVRKLKRSDWFFALLPTIVLMIHIGTLASARSPIFLFETSTIGKASLQQRVVTGFTSALDATVGPKHIAEVKSASHAYRDFYQKEDVMLPVLLWSGIALFAIGAIASLRVPFTAPSNMVTVGETALIGAVALFVSAFIGFVSNLLVTPSRLTGIPSIGLMMLLCVVIESLLRAARSTRGPLRIGLSTLFVAATITVFAYTVRESQAFCSMLKQAGEVNEQDIKIGKQIQALHPKTETGEEIYVRIPRAKNEIDGRWKNFWSGFNSARAGETLWYLYDLDPATISFSSSYFGRHCEGEQMQLITANWAKIGVKKVFPFYVDEKQIVYPIRELDITDMDGKHLTTIDFSSHFSSADLVKSVKQSVPIVGPLREKL